MQAHPSLFGVRAISALARVADGERVENIEGEALDCKEDPSMRDRHGRAKAGAVHSDDAARITADASSCLANHEGGCVLVGLDDKLAGADAILGTRLDAVWLQTRIHDLTNPRLNVSISELGTNGVRVLLIEVPRNESSEPIAASVSKSGGQRRARRVGRECHEMATVAEMIEWARGRSGYDWSARPSGRSPEDVRAGAVDAIRDFLRESGEPDRAALAEREDRDLLGQLQLLRGDGGLTRAGDILLCASIDARLQYALRPALGARSSTRIGQAARGLAEELRGVLDAFRSANPVIAIPGSGLAEGAVEALPFGAVREAIVNAIMHRDWDRPGPIVIDHADSELTVHSPGGFLEGVSEHTVLTAPSRTRNPHLGNVLRSLRLAEREGTGVDRMFIEMVRLGHSPPSFAERDAGVRVALRGGRPVPEVLRVHAALPSHLRRSARSAVIIDLLRTRPSVSLDEVAEGAQEKPEELGNFLRDAEVVGLVQRTANPRRGGLPAWRLADGHRETLGSVLPYYVRPREESVRLIMQLAQSQGEVRNQDVQDLLGLTSARASQLLKRAETDGVITLGPGAKPMGRGTYYVPVAGPREP